MLPRRSPRRQTIAYSALYSDPDALADMFELLDAGRTGEISFPELQRVVDILNGDASEDDDNDDEEDEDGDEGEGSEGSGDDKVGVDVDPLYGVAFRHQPGSTRGPSEPAGHQQGRRHFHERIRGVEPSGRPPTAK